MNNNVLTVLSVLALAIAGFALLVVRGIEIPQPVGAQAGPDYLVKQRFLSGATLGGHLAIATTTSSLTLTDRDLRDTSYISVAAMGAGQAALTLTLPASTAWPSLDRVGEVQYWIVENLAAAATTTTITAGSGVDLDGDTTGDDIINGGVSGKLACWRQAAGTVQCYVNEGVDAN